MKIGLALSGGGMKGIAHAGVLRALEESNIKISIIGGSSSGSLVASLYAMGYSPYYIYALFKQYSKDILKVDSVFPVIKHFFKNKKFNLIGVRKGELIENEFNELAKRKKVNKIKDIKMPLVIPTVDLNEAREYVFTNYIPIQNDKSKYDNEKVKYIDDVSVGTAVRASSSFPGAFCPCNYDNHCFLDGGILDNVPVKEIKKQGADCIIAINFKPEEVGKESNVMDITMRTIDIMGNKISQDCLKSSDFVLTLEPQKMGLFDVTKLDSCYYYGYNRMLEEIKKWKKNYSF